MSTASTQQEREDAAAAFRALNDGRPLTVEEAVDFNLLGWNLRCNRCGSYGSQWVHGQRQGGGSLALCPPHRDELQAELRRHEKALAQLRNVVFEQEPQSQVDARYKALVKRRRGSA